MKNILLFLLLAGVIACTKEGTEPESDLSFEAVSLQPHEAGSNYIVAAATVTGPNLCYRFTHFTVKNSQPNEFDIYARGEVPTSTQVCAQAIYRKDTTVTIAKPAPGTYTLRFWNPNRQLFKSETVTVQ